MLSNNEAVAKAVIKKGQALDDAAIDAGDFFAYQTGIIHTWIRTISALVIILVPLFFILDCFMMPPELLPTFAVFRLASTIFAVGQWLVIRQTKPGRMSYIHPYIVSAQVGGIIALMTTYIGGFDSSYYAGLLLVIIGANLLMPWQAIHTAANAALIIVMYVVFNLIAANHFELRNIFNNLFFMTSTAVITISISYVRYMLIEKEFGLLVELKKARDALWSEMELAKRIQTALLPKRQNTRGFDIAVTMQPALEVGGDYYDIIETENGSRWIAIGDVAGHGVDSGLIMMMAQTSIMTVIKGNPAVKPAEVLRTVNAVIREDLVRLGSNHYMTMMLMQVEDEKLTIVGHHQDVLVYHSTQSKVSSFPTKGTWLGISDEIDPYMLEHSLRVEDNDVIMLFTDGVTEAANAAGEMFGQDRLERAFERHADLPVEQALEQVMLEIRNFQGAQIQEDDITIILLKKNQARATSARGAKKSAASS